MRLNNQPIFDPARKIVRKLPKHTPKALVNILALKDRRAYYRGKQDKRWVWKDIRYAAERCKDLWPTEAALSRLEGKSARVNAKILSSYRSNISAMATSR